MPDQPEFILPFPSHEATSVSRTTATRYLQGAAVLHQAAAAAMLLVAGPVIAMLALAVRATSRGAGLYSQERSGRDGEHFTLYKIRSMRHDAEAATGAVWCKPGDARVTRIGKWLRWSHLDELPQLWNVLRGEMRLIGPRPERPEIATDLMREIPHYEERLHVLPGVTGLAQVNLPPDESLETVQRKLDLDRYYVQNATPWMDVRILVCTALRMIGIRYENGSRWLKLNVASLEGFEWSSQPKAAETTRRAA